MWHLQRVEDAIKMLGAALKILEITHGTNHGMYKDGLDMINICLQGEFGNLKMKVFLLKY